MGKSGRMETVCGQNTEEKIHRVTPCLQPEENRNATSIIRAGLCGVCTQGQLQRGQSPPCCPVPSLGTGHTPGVDTGPPFAVPGVPSRATRPNPVIAGDVLFHVTNDGSEVPTARDSHRNGQPLAVTCRGVVLARCSAENSKGADS